MRHIKQITITVALLFGLVVIFVSIYLQPKVKASVDGQAIYKANCSLCHGTDGSGKTLVGQQLKGRDLRSGETQKQTNAQMVAIITKGKGKMPSFEKSLTKEQINDLVAFIRQLAKKG
jgi:mono/diheme cytochrome c family protein